MSWGLIREIKKYIHWFMTRPDTVEVLLVLYHVFINFKKVFDRVWHAALWATMKKYNISSNLTHVIKKEKKNKVTSAVIFNSSIGDWF